MVVRTYVLYRYGCDRCDYSMESYNPPYEVYSREGGVLRHYYRCRCCGNQEVPWERKILIQLRIVK